MHRISIALLALLTLTAMACGRYKQPSPPSATPPPSAEPTPATPPPVQATETQAAKPPAPPIAEADLRALLDLWLGAQNGGDFDAYAAIYAQRFYGTKRSGARTRTFERKAWLRDRKRMFAKAMNVTATDVAVASTTGSAVLTFVQTWASGTYKDVGPKQLVIVPGDGGLRIAREEMLSSVVEKGDNPITPLARHDFAFVVQDGGESYMVLHLNPEPKWSQGKIELLSSGSSASTRQPAVVEALPESLRGWNGTEVDVQGSHGRVCGGKVDGLYVLSRVEPHFGTVQYWAGERDEPPPAPEKIAEEAWALGHGGRVLVGRVSNPHQGACKSGFWARVAGRPTPTLAATTTADPLLIRSVLDRFRKLRGHQIVQKDYMAEVAAPRTTWWDRFQDAAPAVTVMKDANGQPGWVSVAARAGDGCGEFMGEFWALWRIRLTADNKKPPVLTLLTDERNPGRYFQPRLGVDLDGDGKMEFIGNRGLLQPAGPILRESESVEVPSLDCPC